jgi:hypothetical protein
MIDDVGGGPGDRWNAVRRGLLPSFGLAIFSGAGFLFDAARPRLLTPVFGLDNVFLDGTVWEPLAVGLPTAAVDREVPDLKDFRRVFPVRGIPRPARLEVMSKRCKRVLHYEK